MTRTTATKVRSLTGLPSDYDVDGFIEIASNIVDDVETCSGLSATKLELIERNLAAHYAMLAGAPVRSAVTSKSIDGASTSYTRQQVGEGLAGTPFGKMAETLDTTGCLKKVIDGQASVTWLGEDLSD